MELGLNKKRVLITGSSQGIGKAIANVFLQEGAFVILNGRDHRKLERTKKEMEVKYGNNRVMAFCGDLTKEECLKLLRCIIEEKLGGIDIVIPNIGSGKAETSNMLDTREWHRLIEINLLSAVMLINELSDLLKKGQQSNIVFISSVAGKGISGAPYAYAASKEALVVLAKRLSEDLVTDRIRVNCVLPGNIFFKGGRWEEILEKDYEGTMKVINDTVAMKRLGTPDEIANAVVFLASEKSSFITGTTLIVDGGQLKGI